MFEHKLRTYNFYQKDGKHYIIQCSQPIEVSIEVFNAYKNSIYAQDYNDMYYHDHNFSLENSITTIDKELKAQQFFATEERYLMKESDREFLMKFSPKVRQTVLLWLEGYNDIEVAEKIDISCRYVRKIKAQLRQMFK